MLVFFVRESVIIVALTYIEYLDILTTVQLTTMRTKSSKSESESSEKDDTTCPCLLKISLINICKLKSNRWKGDHITEFGLDMLFHVSWF